jgi:thiamine-phosphate pyrophosphorylase
MFSLPAIYRFQYLTQDLPDITHPELAEIACKSGIRWVQLRVKNHEYTDWLQIAKEVRTITSKYNAFYIVNDNVEIALEVNADGVHLGSNDTPIEMAREILGEEKIIGGTANSLEDILSLQAMGVDYIGLGPYAYTSTKEKLSPVLGLNGYAKIFSEPSLIKVPTIAIGGIKTADVQALLQTGIYGIAISSAINLAADRSKAIQGFLDQFSLTSR